LGVCSKTYGRFSACAVFGGSDRNTKICSFGLNVEDPQYGHMIGIIHHLVGEYKSAYFPEIILKSLQKLIIIDYPGRRSGG
jgi:hypothetical protein